MLRFFKFTMIGAALLLALGACNPGMNTTGPKTYTLSKQDAGRAIDLHPGDQLVITLQGNPTTGYNWEAQPPVDQAVLKQVGEAAFEPNSNLVGSGGMVTLTFEAAGAGKTDLSLVYHRSWESNVAPQDTFKVSVNVSE